MSVNNPRLTGANPLAYMGIEASNPPLLKVVRRPPTAHDKRGYKLCDIWIDLAAGHVWMLVSLVGGAADWVRIVQDAAGATQFVTDAGIATPALTVLNVLGDGVHVSTLGAANAVTSGLTNGVLNGQLLVAGGANPPVWARLASAGGTVAITYPGANRINLEAAGGGAIAFVSDDMAQVDPLLGVIVVGGGGVTNINTVAAGNTLTVNLNNAVTLPALGTLTFALLGFGVMQSDAAGVITSDTAANGYAMISATGAAPDWGLFTSGDGSIAITHPAANRINLEYTGGVGPGASTTAFLSYLGATAAGVIVDWIPFTMYGIGTTVALTTVFDINNDFYDGSGAGAPAAFTAPAAGRYFLNIESRVQGLNNGPYLSLWIEVRTTSRTYNLKQTNSAYFTTIFANENFQQVIKGSICVEMAMGDTATFYIGANATTTGASINKDLYGGVEMETWISGYNIP